MSAPAPLLSATTLARAFGGVVAVDAVSFSLAAGETLAVIGPNGAGKSTLFALIAGQLRPDRGQVRLEGRDVTRLPPHRRARLGLGRTFQAPRVFGALGLGEGVHLAASLCLPAARARARARMLIARLGLEALTDRPVPALAYGDLRRLDLALALATSPRVLLLDEPVAGMAPAERAQLMTLVRAIAAEENLGVLFTEHDMDVVFGHAGRVLVLDHGRVIADGPPDAVRRDPVVRQRYLGTP
ncbi:ABC transporter ATP-binding protein [Pararhodospirillum oryzae]|uniref:ABC transporter ATP-binding protein n=1 Tax=Pararhodospirillum oryzae TaxID=478448 RepID=A0A512H8I7_9PROT|nr:ATP-binding cassette domain-containing protein [Pararhodospirillum oryzae]GEO81710.1 ABC transporter ATP-binding protein [Pararhodospirillum oryzae]